MLKRLKEWGMTVLLICPDGLTIFLSFLLMEILYRALTLLGYASSGLEFILLAVGLGFFLLILLWRLLGYWRRK